MTELHVPAPVAAPTAASDLDSGSSGRVDVFDRLLKNRVVFLGTDVNDNVANELIAQINYTLKKILLDGTVTQLHRKWDLGQAAQIPE